jgi:glucose/arabinose dehydrogenase/PKD repeat protein
MCGRHARVLLLLSTICLLQQVARGAVPTGFQDSLVASVSSPTALAFTPDGRLLITAQTGRLWINQGTALLPNPALDLGPVLCSNSERGLLGVAVDPAFTTNRFIYLFYTYKKSGVCELNTANAPVNRVSRFTLADTNTVSPSTELVLLDNIPSPAGNHNAGDVQFGHDGLLYVSVGDGGCDYLGNSGCAGANDAARDHHVTLGKILRITSTGAIPSGNPFTGADSVRCNTTGRAAPGQKCRETFAWGLRNPFRMAFDPNAAGTRFFINDVGQNTWEEIDEGRAGADYGWNVREGHCVNGSTTNCGAPPAGMTNPIFDYSRSGGCAAITGGAFVPRGVWPAEFEGQYLFGDYVCGRIFRLSRNADGTYSQSTFASGLGGSSAVAMIFGPWEATQALYYTTYAGGGQVRRITSTVNRAPTATLTASPRSGPAPLTVRFDASGSSDPDGQTLSFEWDFGDGIMAPNGSVQTHTYQNAGRFTARVTVRDGAGGSSSASATIDAGNTPPVPTINSPTSSAKFSVGQTITLNGSATDAEDGSLPASGLSWAVTLHHNTHTHPYVPPTAGNNVTFQAPAPEDLAATTTSFVSIQLTATDSNGAMSTVTRTLQPNLVNVTLDSVPSGLTLSVNGTTVSTPRTVTSWDKYVLTLGAATQRDTNATPWLFSTWSDGGAATHVMTTPASAATVTATFARATAASPSADAYVRAGASASQSFGTAAELVVKQSTAADYQRRTHLRFPIGSGPVGRALLRLRGALSSSGDMPVSVYPVSNITWPEGTLTWNTQPPAGATASASNRVASTSSAWYEWDVTAYVRSERTAGRTSASFVLVGTAATEPFASFASREASSNRPELLISEAASPTPSPGEIVLYAREATAISGAWRLVADATAAGGSRIFHPDAGAPKLAAPLASPSAAFELSFTAEAGRPYRLWIRGQAERNSYSNDSAYVQFSGSVTSAGAPTFRIGSASATTYVLEDCSGCGLGGWGWQDNAYGPGALGPAIYFATTGPQTLRIQNREDGLSIDQVILSPTAYFSRPPGATKNDTTIVAKP